VNDPRADAVREGVARAFKLNDHGHNSGEGERKLSPPMGVEELLAVEAPEEEWLVEGILPAGGNILVAGYPKTYKTMWLLLQGVCLASGEPFLGFPVPARRRVGIVLMEDQAHRVRHRLARLCRGLGVDLEDLEGWLFLWFRPPLRLNDRTAQELAEYAREKELDFLGIDSWSYVASGDSNSSDDVTPQLQALSGAREARPGLTVQLTHHARKDWGKQAGGGTRLTDEIRNSSAFGAWYDAGLVLSRKDETSPIKVRAELRDFPAPQAFAFTVEDEEPAMGGNGWTAQGWLRFMVSAHRPEVLDRIEAARRLVPAVREFLAAHPEGVSRSKLRSGVTGRNPDVEAAFEILEKAGEAVAEGPDRNGRAATYRLTGDLAPGAGQGGKTPVSNPAPPCPDPAPGKVSGEGPDPAPTPIGEGRGSGAPLQATRGTGGRGGQLVPYVGCEDCGRLVEEDPTFSVQRCSPCAVRAGKRERQHG